jgi:hypothetical protein
VVYDQGLHRSPDRLQLEAELFPNGLKEGGPLRFQGRIGLSTVTHRVSGGLLRKLYREIVMTRQSGLIDDRPA